MKLLLSPCLCKMPWDACLTTSGWGLCPTSHSRDAPLITAVFSTRSRVIAPIPQAPGLLGWPLWYPQWSERCQKVQTVSVCQQTAVWEPLHVCTLFVWLGTPAHIILNCTGTFLGYPWSAHLNHSLSLEGNPQPDPSSQLCLWHPEIFVFSTCWTALQCFLVPRRLPALRGHAVCAHEQPRV